MSYIKIWAIISSLLLMSGLKGQHQYDVYVFLAEECPISIYMARPLREAMKEHQQRAKFHAVFPVKTSTAKSINSFLEGYELTGWIPVIDHDQRLMRELAATVTPEVVIVDRKTRQLYYRGRISNAYAAPGKMRHGARTNELRTMLSRLAEGHIPTAPWPAAVGCYITPVNAEN